MNNLNKNLNRLILPAVIIFALSLTRIIPHPSNFTPILAVGIFAGFYFKQFYLSFFVVIFSMFVGDLFLGFHDTMLFTYFSLGIVVLIGMYIKNLNLKETLVSSILSSVCFFLITNFGAWITLEMYEKSFSGLLQSYVMAIPFFHNTLISTIIYLTVLKFLYDLAKKKNFYKHYF